MNRFYISEITVAGPAVRASTIRFTKGVNIIHGPSNTGKSQVLECLDFMFGSKESVPFDSQETGYDTVIMTLQDEHDDWFRAERKLVLGDTGIKGDTNVTVTSSLPYVEAGEYNIANKSYSNLLLKLMGVETCPKIYTSQERKAVDLTIRAFFHQLYLKEETILKKPSVMYNPGYNNTTLSLSAFYYLLTGLGASVIVTENGAIREAKKEAVINYINKHIAYYSAKKTETEKYLSNLDSVDPDARLEEVVEEIDALERQISKAHRQSRDLTRQILSIGESLEQAKVLKDRYLRLQSQYESDIKRLNFIAEGSNQFGRLARVDKCPFCDHEMEPKTNVASYVNLTRAEMDRVKEQRSGLLFVEDELAEQIKEMETELQKLDNQRALTMHTIKQSYKPRMAELKNTLEKYNHITQLKNEVSKIEEVIDKLKADLVEKASESDETQKYDAKAAIEPALFAELSNAVQEAISCCSYPSFTGAYIDRSSYDVVVNGKKKASQGKGYRAYLNSIYAFTLMKFLEKKGKYPPKMLLLDSPILSLKENIDIPATDSMKTGLFRYMLSNCGDCQLIIAENDLPEGVDYSSATMIEFTKDPHRDRYGFMLDYFNPGDSDGLTVVKP